MIVSSRKIKFVNVNHMKTESTGFTTKRDEVPDVNINNKRDWKEEPNPKLDVEDKEIAHNYCTEGEVVAKK